MIMDKKETAKGLTNLEYRLLSPVSFLQGVLYVRRLQLMECRGRLMAIDRALHALRSGEHKMRQRMARWRR